MVVSEMKKYVFNKNISKQKKLKVNTKSNGW